jgi:hypothetical protein
MCRDLPGRPGRVFAAAGFGQWKVFGWRSVKGWLMAVLPDFYACDRVAAAFVVPVESGQLDLPLPGGGRTRERWSAFADRAFASQLTDPPPSGLLLPAWLVAHFSGHGRCCSSDFGREPRRGLLRCHVRGC